VVDQRDQAPVKFYSLTRAGKRQLQQATADWERLAGAITLIVRTV